MSLEAVEQQQENEGLHIRLRYDADSVHASVYDGEDHVMSTGYVWVRNSGGWDKARAEVLKEAAKKVEIMRKYGKPPADERVPLEDLPPLEEEAPDA